MTIAQNFASKFAVAFVAVAMIFSMFATAVSAQESNEDLQDTINDLLAQIATLQAGMTTTTTTTTTSCDVPAAPLTIGSQGGGVTSLQNILIAGGFSIPAGATGYFGTQTQSAVAAWQAANGVAPAAGYYGPITMAALQAKCVPDDTDDEDDEDEDDEDTDLQGEGSLDTFEVDDASDTDVEEGAEDGEIAELTLEATDGDIEVDRMTFTLDAGNTNEEKDPWEVFETITLWVDGDMIAEFTADDEDEYLDEDTGEFRFSGLGLVLREDEEVEVIVGATVMSSVDGADTASDAAWTLTATEVRYFDADGVAEDDDTTDELPSGSADFDIVAEGDGEELKFSLGDNNPEATDIIVDVDDTTDGATVLEYTIEAKDNDIELNKLFVDIVTSTTSSLVIDDVTIEIDGESFDAENSAVSNSNTTQFEFDIDGDIVVEEDEEVTVVVMVDLRSQESSNNVSRYPNGTTIKATVDVDATDAEGADDIGTGDLTGSAVGDTHTIVAEGIVVPVDGFSSEVDTLGQNDTIGEFTLEFEVTAVEGDFYITDNVSTSTSVEDGIRYSIDPGAAGAATAVLDSTGDEDTSGVYTVEEGETETFTLTVTFDPTATGSFRVQLEEVWYSDNTDGDTGAVMYVPSPLQDFRSASQPIQGS